ncbi:hypothetical protein I3843_05G024900 [Carya illinoinensis]|nr:hypothetical protein I3843_05G024900 [Carya illinoinensis]
MALRYVSKMYRSSSSASSQSEQTFPVSRTQEHCVLFQKKTINSFQEKGYKFMHIASVQIAVILLVRKGINACVLLCLHDGIIQTSLVDGPVHFNCYPDLTVDLFDKNTSGFNMVEGSRPISLVYRIYYRVLSTSLEPKAKIKSPKNEIVLMYSSTSNSSISTPKMLFWKDVTLPDEWVLKQELPPVKIPAQNSDLKSIQQYFDGTVKISFDQPLIRERRNSFAGSRSSFSSDQDLRDKNLERYLKDHENPNRSIQIRELQSKEGPSDQDIQLEGISTKSQVTSTYYSTKDDIKFKGKSIKKEVQVEDDVESTSLTTFDMVAPIHPSLMVLDKVLNDLDSELLVIDMINLHADFMSKENYDKRKTYHKIYSVSEKQNIRKEWKKKMKEVKASPFKISDPGLNENVFTETKKIIEQNNFVNQTLHTIGQQLDRTQGSPDGVNTLIFTIVKHFVGTPSNITNRVSDYLNNLRCNKMSDYRWYKDVFMSRVMLREDSQKPFWKENKYDSETWY